MADLIRTYDWAATPIGPLAQWPSPLRTAIDVMLSSGFLASVAWGPDLVVVYNDEMAGMLDDHHPRLFAQPLFASIPDDRRAVYHDRYARVREGETVTIDAMHYPRQSNGKRSDAWLSARYLPLRDESGDVAGMMTLATDITARVQAETRGDAADAARRRSEGMFRALAESIDDVFYVTNLREQRLEYLSPSFPRVWGRPRSVLDDLSAFAETIHPDDHPTLQRDKALQARGKRVSSEYRVIRPDGEIRWILDRAFPMRGAKHLSAGIASDITARKRNEERMTQLFAELQHRTRNLMGVVRSMFENSLDAATDLASFSTTFRARLDSLARVQSLLSELDEGDRITFDALLRGELASLSPSAAEGPGPRITLRGPAGVRLRSVTVQTFALALHELASNARRHGALSQPAGRLAVDWRMETRDDGALWLVIDWVESGVTLPPPAPQGYGRELIERALPYQLDAATTLTFGQDGITCHIELPLTGLVRK